MTKRCSRPAWAIVIHETRFAYHATTESILPQIVYGGLMPMPTSVKLRGDKALFFTDSADGAIRYFADRIDPVLLRFPWPSDAECEPDECISRLDVPPHLIEVYEGRLLDRASDLYWVGDPEERYGLMDRILSGSTPRRVERASAWRRLVPTSASLRGLAHPVRR